MRFLNCILFALTFLPGIVNAQSNCFETCFQDITKSKLPPGERNDPFLQSLIGCKVPGFKFTALNGDEVNLADLKGKVIVMNFWFVECAPCRFEIPGLNRLANEYASNKDVIFLAFARDNSATVKDFVQDHPFDFKIIPHDDAFPEKYCILGWPTNMIVDKQGSLRFIHAGGTISGDKEIIYRQLKPIIDNYLL